MTNLRVVSDVNELPQTVWHGDWTPALPLGIDMESLDEVGQINIVTLSEADVPSDSRWVPTVRMPLLLRLTDEGVWASHPTLDEHAVGNSRSEAMQALWRTLEDYYQSLKRREERLSDRLATDLNYLERVLKPRK